MGLEKEKKVEEIRKEIDGLDEKLVELLNDRAALAIKIGEEKSGEGKTIYDPSREKEILKKLTGRKNLFPEAGIKSVLDQVMIYSRTLQGNISIAFLGPKNTFTHIAALKRFGGNAKHIAKQSIQEVFSSVEKGETNYGVIPVENSSQGTVNNTLDMFIYSDLKIAAEILLEVKHSLLSKYSLDEITKVYSRPIALAQCRDYLMENLPKAELIEVSSTSKAAEMASIYHSSAAIASEQAAKENELNVIARNIQDQADNVTRFIVISKKNNSNPTGKDKTSIMFSVRHEPGALVNVLEALKKENINMTKIESRPTRMKSWEYIFFVDVQGHERDEKIRKALKELEAKTSFLKVLGTYPEETEVMK
ncbi:MAG: prephenate dehydratase [Candidatus Diapherotrites archaeon]